MMRSYSVLPDVRHSPQYCVVKQKYDVYSPLVPGYGRNPPIRNQTEVVQHNKEKKRLHSNQVDPPAPILKTEQKKRDEQ